MDFLTEKRGFHKREKINFTRERKFISQKNNGLQNLTDNFDKSHYRPSVG